MIKNLNIVKTIDDTNNPNNLNNIDPDKLNGITNGFVENIDCICLDEFNIKPNGCYDT